MYVASKLQTVMRDMQVKDVVDANRMVCGCVVGAKRGLRYPSKQFRWADTSRFPDAGKKV